MKRGAGTTFRAGSVLVFFGMLFTEKLGNFDASETEKYLVAECALDFILLSWG